MPDLVGQRGKEPEVCACCGRRATGYGLSTRPRGGNPVLWVCSIDCVKLVKKVRGMNNHELDVYEDRALDEAAEHIAQDMVTAIMETLFEMVPGGDMNKLDPDGFDKIVVRIKSEKSIKPHLKTALLAFQSQMRDQLKDYSAPF